MTGMGKLTQEPNLLGTTGDKEYPTVVYSLLGEPRAFSGWSFTNALRFAIRCKKWCDEGTRPTLIFTDSMWDI